MKKLLQHKEEICLYALTYIGGVCLIMGGIAFVCWFFSLLLHMFGIN